VRVFFAIEPAEGARIGIARVQDRVREALGAAKVRASFPRVEGLHVTVRFVGEVGEEKVAAIASAVRGSVRVAPFSARFSGLGVFPSARSPRVVWIGVDKGSEAFQDAAEQVDRCLETLGFVREKPLVPHLTLARLRERWRFDASLFETVSFGEELSSLVTELVLYRSDSDGGVHYTAIERFPFARTENHESGSAPVLADERLRR
jgi:2'-5' RNA ligase